MRTRHQAGSLQKRKHGKLLMWVGLYRDEKNSRRYVTLGPAKEMTESQAKAKLAEHMVEVNRARAIGPAASKSTVAGYVRNVFLPLKERQWKESTLETSRQRIIQHIVNGELGPLELADLDREKMQAFLDARRPKDSNSDSVVKHLRWDLKSICELAFADGLMRRNQAAVLVSPKPAFRSARPVMTMEQVTTALAVLDLRERLFCRFAIFGGLRPGEIIALRWSDIVGATALVDDRVYKGKTASPKNSRARVAALGDKIMPDLATWREFSADLYGRESARDAYIFPTESGKTPIKYENLWQRIIQKRFKKVGIAWADFRCMRRTNASLMNSGGADAKAAADNRGHGLGVSLETYTQTSVDEKLAAVRKMERLIQ